MTFSGGVLAGERLPGIADGLGSLVLASGAADGGQVLEGVGAE